MSEFDSDNEKNIAIGDRFLTALQRAPHLTCAIIKIPRYSDRSKYTLFDITDNAFLTKMRFFIQAHGSLEKFSLSTPEIKLNFTRIVHETSAGRAIDDISFLLEGTKRADISGLSFVAQNMIVDHLVVDLTKGYFSRNMQSAIDVLVHHPFEYVTLASAPGESVDEHSLEYMLKIINAQKASIELNLKLPTRYILPLLGMVSGRIPNVRKTTFEYHPNQNEADLLMHTEQIIGGRSLIRRLLALLNDAPTSRTVPQRQITEN